jgi:uncharacterized damage-inducible protein DinB
LFGYTTFTWAVYGRSLETLPAGAFTHPVEGSGWPSMRDALFHVAGAWDGWLAGYLKVNVTIANPADLTTWAQVDAYRNTMRGLLHRIIEETSDEEFDRPMLPLNRPAAPGVEGGQLLASAAQVVAHLLLHERGHHGDISTLIHQLGGTPPPIDYLSFVRLKHEQGAR